MKHRWGLFTVIPPKEQDFERPIHRFAKLVPVKNKTIKVFSTIHGFFADVTVQATYYNHNIHNVDGVFIFPSEYKAALYHFEAINGGRTIKAAYQHKERYETRNKTEATTVLEQLSSDMFTCQVGSIQSEHTVAVTLRYALELSILDDGAARFKFPTDIPKVFRTKYTNYQPRYYRKPNYNFHFKAVLSSQFVIRKILSDELLDVSFLDRSGCLAELSSVGGLAPLTDFAFSIFYADIQKPHLELLRGQPQCGDLPQKWCQQTGLQLNSNQPDLNWNGVYDMFCGMLTLYHQSNRWIPSKQPMEYIFCVDRSCSMSGQKIWSAAQALLQFLRCLPTGCYFNVISFGSFFSPLFRSSRVKNRRNMHKALRLQRKLRADMNATELLPLLNYICSQPTITLLPKQVFLITDGAVSNTSECLLFVKQRKECARFFTIGIGNTASRSLVSGLARATSGKARYVRSTDQLDTVVVDFMKLSMQPCITDLQLNLAAPDGITFKAFPSKLSPSRYPCEGAVCVYILIGGELSGKETHCSLEVSASIGSEPYQHQITFDLRDARVANSLPLHRLIVKQLIMDLELEISETEHSFSSSSSIARSQLVNMSQMCNLPCCLTSCIAIDTITGQEVGREHPLCFVPPEENPTGMTASGKVIVRFRNGIDIYEPKRNRTNRHRQKQGKGHTARRKQPVVDAANRAMQQHIVGVAQTFPRGNPCAPVATVDSDIALSECSSVVFSDRSQRFTRFGSVGDISTGTFDLRIDEISDDFRYETDKVPDLFNLIEEYPDKGRDAPLHTPNVPASQDRSSVQNCESNEVVARLSQIQKHEGGRYVDHPNEPDNYLTPTHAKMAAETKPGQRLLFRLISWFRRVFARSSGAISQSKRAVPASDNVFRMTTSKISDAANSSKCVKPSEEYVHHNHDCGALMVRDYETTSCVSRERLELNFGELLPDMRTHSIDNTRIGSRRIAEVDEWVTTAQYAERPDIKFTGLDEDADNTHFSPNSVSAHQLPLASVTASSSSPHSPDSNANSLLTESGYDSRSETTITKRI